MTSTMEVSIEERVTTLVILGAGEGLTSTTPLSKNVQELFGLDSYDPLAFSAKLSGMREYLPPCDVVDAAYNALGVDTIGGPDMRRNALLFERHGGSWGFSDASLLELQEIHGFYIIASLYDLSKKLQKLTKVARQAADMLQTGAQVRRMINMTLEEINPQA